MEQESLFHGRAYRLPKYDYSQNGWYFVTFCTKNRECTLSSVTQEPAACGRSNVGRGLAPGMADTVISLKPIGKILNDQILALPERFGVAIHYYVIMPNHCHILLGMERNELPGASPRPTGECLHDKGCRPSIQQIVGVLKSMTTRLANQTDGAAGRVVFQSSFHDHVIRNENDYIAHAQYILDNPGKWISDEYYCA